ncbi:hypothetical protein HYW17_00505 [Candidatus Uhrbacteria bacterium]|nr:hypothetical protein [Candidatus Uhrbacteria bacterium]
MHKLSIRIETTPSGKPYLPWVTAVRRGRESSETQCFALLGCPEPELNQLPPSTQEHVSELIEFALKLFGAFEYIPRDPALLDGFFEKKLINFEERLRGAAREELPIHGAIGVLINTRVLFATVGEILALQISPSSIINIAASGSGHPFHFDTFHSGVLTPRSHLLFIPKRMGTLFKSDELKQLTFAGSTGPKITYLEHIWGNRGTSGALKAILLETKVKLPVSANTTEVSIARLLDTEAKTEELLSPPLMRPLVNQFRRSAQKLFEKIDRVKTGLSALKTKDTAEKTAPEGTPDKTPTLPPLLRYSSRFARSFHNKFSALKRTIPPPVSPFKGLKKIPALSLLNLEQLIARFNALPRLSKVLFLLTLLVFFVFTQSVFLGLGKARTRQFKNALQSEVDAIRTLLNEGSAAAIYGDEDGAQAKIDEVTLRINSLTAFQKERLRELGIRPLRRFDLSLPRATIEELNGAIEPIKAALRHLITIESPQTVSEPLRSALRLGEGSPLRARYGKRLYTLVPEQNQILKHEPKDSGFDAGASWIKDGTAVRDGVALAVDGSVYVLEGTGNVLEFRKGARVSFALKNIDPPLSGAAKIWTHENSSYLYILEPSTKRLAVFAKKDGLLKTQYTSPSFTDLKDFKIDEPVKTAYMSSGTDIFSIPLSHL